MLSCQTIKGVLPRDTQLRVAARVTWQGSGRDLEAGIGTQLLPEAGKTTVLLPSQRGPSFSLTWQLRDLLWEVRWAISSPALITTLTPEASWPSLRGIGSKLRMLQSRLLPDHIPPPDTLNESPTHLRPCLPESPSFTCPKGGRKDLQSPWAPDGGEPMGLSKELSNSLVSLEIWRGGKGRSRICYSSGH